MLEWPDMQPFGNVQDDPQDWNKLDWGAWLPVEYDVGTCLEQVLGDLDTERLGSVLHAWQLPTGEMEVIECSSRDTREEVGVISEVIEHWCVLFKIGENQCSQKDGCFYRYRVDDPGNGQIYRTLSAALRGEGGRTLTAVLADAIDCGLILPRDFFSEVKSSTV